MPETKLNENNPHHSLLIGIFGTFVEDFGYSPRELFMLIEDAKRQTFHALLEMHKERGTHD